MSERRDDTTEREEPSGEKSESRKPGSYYYDDATGYQIYDPEQEDEDDEDEVRGEASPHP